MASLLFEDPWVVGLLGGLAGGLMLIVWTQTSHHLALKTGIGLLLLTVVLIVVNVHIKTDREKIRELLRSVAAALEHNDHGTVLASIHPNAVEIRRRAESELPRYEFTFAKVTGIRSIDVNRHTTPPTAQAEFFVRVHLRYQGQLYRISRFVRLYLMLHDDHWYVRDYEHYDPSVGIRH